MKQQKSQTGTDKREEPSETSDTQVKRIREWQPINTMTSQQETGSDTESDTESDSYKIKEKHQGEKINKKE